jgi:hypothetical protein
MNVPDTDVARGLTGIRDFRTRHAARLALRRRGRAIAPALLDLLRDAAAPENARWVALDLLAEWRCRDAAPALLDLLRSAPALRRDAVRALEAITGRAEGEDAESWARAVAETCPSPAAAAEPPEFALVREAVGDVALELCWEADGYAYLRLPAAAGRTQQVLVLFETDAAGARLASLYTECGRYRAGGEEAVRRRNATGASCTFQAEPGRDGQPMVTGRLRLALAGLAPATLRAHLLAVAREADDLEEELSGAAADTV